MAVTDCKMFELHLLSSNGDCPVEKVMILVYNRDSSKGRMWESSDAKLQSTNI